MLHLHPRSELQQVRFTRFPHWSAVICEITAPQWWPVILTLSFLFFVYIWDVVAMLWPFPYKSRIRNTTRAPRCHNVHILYRVENNTGVLLGAWFYSLCNFYNGRLIVGFLNFTCLLVTWFETEKLCPRVSSWSILIDLCEASSADTRCPWGESVFAEGG